MKLKPLSDFVLEQKSKLGLGGDTYECFYKKTTSYTDFLKQPLTLGMFVPCDENGNILNPKKFTIDGHPIFDGGVLYQEAQERVLFKGFYKEFNAVMSPAGGYLDTGRLKHKTIEDIIGANLELTESAIKQLGL